jgi:hypothetical protein
MRTQRINLSKISSFTKYPNRFIHFTEADCDRIKSDSVEPYGWVELLSDNEGKPTSDIPFDELVLNAFLEGNNCNLNGYKAEPNCYLARHNGENGILVIGVDIVLLGTEYAKTNRSLIDTNKLIARCCDLAEMMDQYHKNHPMKIDFKFKIWVRTGFILPEASVGVFIFVPDYSISMNYFSGRENNEPLSRIPYTSLTMYSMVEVEFNPIWQKESMLRAEATERI